MSEDTTEIRLGTYLVDGHGGRWEATTWGLRDEIGDADWDWQSVLDNGGLGTLQRAPTPAELVPLPPDAVTLLNSSSAVTAELKWAGEPRLLADLAHMADSGEDAARTTLHWYEQIRGRRPDLTTDEALALAVVFYYG